MTGKKPRDFQEAIDHIEKGAGDVRERLEGELKRIEETLKEMAPEFEKVGRSAKGRVEARLQEHPWATLGLIGLLGLVLGYLLGSRSRD